MDCKRRRNKNLEKKKIVLVSIQCDAPTDGGCSNGLESIYWFNLALILIQLDIELLICI